MIGPSQRPKLGKPQHSQDTDIQGLGWIRTVNSIKRAAAGVRLRTRSNTIWFAETICEWVMHLVFPGFVGVSDISRTFSISPL
jgi:hypothetical protein